MCSIEQSSPSAWRALIDVARWDYQQCASGPLARLLVHLVADPLGRLRGAETLVRFNARLLLRDGRVWAVGGKCPPGAVLTVLQGAAGVLIDRPCDEARFGELDDLIAQALGVAGQGAALIELDRRPCLSPRPVLGAAQLERLALHALTRERAGPGEAAPDELPASLSVALRQACTLDDRHVRAWQAGLDAPAQAFTAKLPPAHGIPADSLLVYNLLSCAAGHCRNRLQAMRSMPWLLPVLLSSPRGLPGDMQCGSFDAIAAAIDIGAPLVRALGAVFGVPGSAVRHLAAVPPPAAWELDSARASRLLFLLACLPPERRPATDADYTALITLGNALPCVPLLRDADASSLEDALYPDCMRACISAWLRQLTPAGLAAAVADAGFARLRVEMADAGDFLHALCEALQLDDSAAGAGALAQVGGFCARVTLRRLLALSRQWHVLLASTPVEVQRERRWPGVLCARWRHAHIDIVELTDSHQLQAEGMAMAHCVASYVSACADGDSVIVSLRGPAGAPLSTAQLRVQQGAPRVRIEQHRAARNGLPARACIDALDALVRHLNLPAQGAALQARLAFQQPVGRRPIAGRGGAVRARFGQAARQSALRLAGLGEPASGAPSASIGTTLQEKQHAAITH